MGPKRTVAEPAPTLFADFEDVPAPLYVGNELLIRGAACGAVTARIGEMETVPSQRLPTFPHHAERVAAWPDPAQASFELRLDCSTWGRGVHRIELTARAADGHERTVVGHAEVEAYREPDYRPGGVRPEGDGSTAMWCEAPNLFGGAPVATPVEVNGWAYGTAGVEGVSVTVDGWVREGALTELPRPDLQELLGVDAAGRGGFALTLDPATCPPGFHYLEVVAVGRDGRSVGVQGWFQCYDGETRVEPSRELLSDGRFVPEIHGETSISPEHQARYRWAAGVAAGCRVLDSGCGVGWGTALIAEAGAVSVTGLDVSAVAIESARARNRPDVEFMVGDLEELPYDDGAFDLVTCFEVIEHVKDAGKALDELARVVADGGALLISSPNPAVYPPGNEFHTREFLPEEIASELLARFPSVLVHRQHTVVASILADAAVMGLADPGATTGFDVRKEWGAAPGEELYTVATASKGADVAAPSELVLGRPLSEEIATWRARSRQAEMALSRLRRRP